MTQLIRQPLSPYNLSFHMMSQRSPLIVILSTLMTPFPVLHHHFSMAVLLCLLRLRVMTHFLTHIILHAGRIFRQRHRNHIVCLVVESALHVYKDQLSPWFEKIYYSDITGILIFREYSYNKIHQHCFRHCIALTLDLQVWSV